MSGVHHARSPAVLLTHRRALRWNKTATVVKNLDIIGLCALDLPLPSADYPGRHMILLMQTITHTPTIDDTTTCHVRAAGRRRPTLPVHTTKARWQHAVTCSRQSRALPLRQTRHDHYNIHTHSPHNTTQSVRPPYRPACIERGVADRRADCSPRGSVVVSRSARLLATRPDYTRRIHGGNRLGKLRAASYGGEG